MASEFTPPLPKCVLDVLSRTTLAYLATCQEDEGQAVPHLSLMNFSVVALADEGDIGIVMSTKKATKKYEALLKNPRVAILVHDFQGLRNSGNEEASVIADAPTSPVPAGVATTKEEDFYSRGSASVTIYGRAETLSEGMGDESKENLRKKCLDSLLKATDRKYLQFMSGPDCALLLVRPELARVCDILDKVTTWEKPSAASAKA
jgi:nitroimidazol reductase NimA-like FMN-containing flavoprotein (pyridoxamine 5'-phosphate oxidase superfamily)